MNTLLEQLAAATQQLKVQNESMEKILAPVRKQSLIHIEEWLDFIQTKEWCAFVEVTGPLTVRLNPFNLINRFRAIYAVLLDNPTVSRSIDCAFKKLQSKKEIVIEVHAKELWVNQQRLDRISSFLDEPIFYLFAMIPLHYIQEPLAQFFQLRGVEFHD